MIVVGSCLSYLLSFLFLLFIFQYYHAAWVFLIVEYSSVASIFFIYTLEDSCHIYSHTTSPYLCIDYFYFCHKIDFSSWHDAHLNVCNCFNVFLVDRFSPPSTDQSEITYEIYTSMHMHYKNSIGKQGFYLILEGQCWVKIHDHQKHAIEVKYVTNFKITKNINSITFFAS